MVLKLKREGEEKDTEIKRLNTVVANYSKKSEENLVPRRSRHHSENLSKSLGMEKRASVSSRKSKVSRASRKSRSNRSKKSRPRKLRKQETVKSSDDTPNTTPRMLSLTDEMSAIK